MAAKKAATTPSKTTARKSTAKKVSATKATPSKAPAKSAPAPTSGTGGTAARTSAPVATDAPPATFVGDRAPDSAPIQMGVDVSPDAAVTLVAAETLHGSRIWGTGRDRDTRLRKAGLDPQAVATERNRLRKEARDRAAEAEKEAAEERLRLRREARKNG